MPQPLQAASMTSAIFFSSSNWMAACGQRLDTDAAARTFLWVDDEIVGSTFTVGIVAKARAPAAAAPAWATVSGMSLGHWQQPAMKMPSVTVLHRLELGVRSRKKPFADS